MINWDRNSVKDNATNKSERNKESQVSYQKSKSEKSRFEVQKSCLQLF